MVFQGNLKLRFWVTWRVVAGEGVEESERGGGIGNGEMRVSRHLGKLVLPSSKFLIIGKVDIEYVLGLSTNDKKKR